MANVYFRILRRSAVARAVVRWAKRQRWPGFQQVSLFDTIVFVVNESMLNDIALRSYSIAYTLFISLFPTVLVLFTLIPYLPLYGMVEESLQIYLYDLLPGEAADVAYDLVRDIGTRERNGLLWFSVVLALYFSSNGMMALMRSFEKEYAATYRQRRIVRKRLIAIGLTLSFGALLIGAALLTAVGTAALDIAMRFYDLGSTYALALRAVQWFAITAFLYSGIALTYKYGSALKTRFRFISPGAILATLLCILTSLAFALYVNNFDSYNKLYGSIGTVIVFMLWLQLVILWILIGYELNAAIAVKRDLKQARPDREPA